MAEIVILNSWREQHDDRRPEIRIGEGADTRSAQLLWFTGVRYERIEPTPAKPGPGAPMRFEQN